MRKTLLQVGAALAAVSGAPIAAGQAQENVSEATLEEVTVTAQKRAENLQDVPVAVSAVTAQMFEQYASPDLAALSGSIPNVYVQPTPGGSGIIQVSIRGIQFAENDKTFELPVGVVLDGVYLGAAQGALLETFDLERIEVLRGPQGTLFGKNTTGGVINAVRTLPTGEWGAKVGVKAGNFDRRDYKAVLNFPIVDQRLAGKVAVFSENEGGVRNLAFPGRRDGERDYMSATAALLFTPGDAWEVLLTYDHVRDKSDSPPLINQFQSTPTVLPIPSNTPIVYPADRPCTVFNICPPLDLRHTRMNAAGSVDSTLDALTANITWNLSDDLDLVAITGWRDGTEDILMDWDATELTIFHTRRDDEKLRQFSQELRLEGRLGDRLSLVAGLFYFDLDHKTDVPRIQDIGYIRGVPALVGVRNLFFPGTEISSRTYVDYAAQSYAAFAQADWSLTDRLTLTLGARYTHDEKEIDFRLLNPDGSIVGPPQGAIVQQRIVQNESWSEVTPRVSLQYQVADDVLTYLSFTRGFNAGGFSGRASDISTVGPYDPETITSYELGLKSEWLNRRLRLNGAVFHTRYKDKQEEINTPTTLPPFTGTSFTNASSARIQGLELELTALPFDRLTLSGSLGYLDARYEDFMGNITGAGVTDNSSLELRRSPEISGNVGADYKFSLGAGQMNFGARYRYIDEHELSVTNDPVGHVPATGYVDAAAGYEFDVASAAWRVNFYGRNLGDEVVKNVFFRTGGFLSFTSAERGREYGVELQAQF